MLACGKVTETTATTSKAACEAASCWMLVSGNVAETLAETRARISKAVSEAEVGAGLYRGNDTLAGFTAGVGFMMALYVRWRCQLDNFIPEFQTNQF